MKKGSKKSETKWNHYANGNEWRAREENQGIEREAAQGSSRWVGKDAKPSYVQSLALPEVWNQCNFNVLMI